MALDTRMFGDYNVIKQIGHGSLGTVYLVEHRFMKRQFVLKVLPEELSTDRSFIQRLEDDVSILASLDHPNIVKIHNVSFAQGQYFLVTDCVVDELGETTNLAQFMLSQTKRLDEETLYRLLHQIAVALHYAHNKKISGKGISHRGIKLNNILIGKSKAGGIDAYLSDFGLSRVVGTGGVLMRTYLMVAESLGIGAVVANTKISQRYPSVPIETAKLTPLHLSFLQNYAFLAPEQKRLDALNNAESKADVYAFGVLVYWLLMGEFPEGIFDLPSAHCSEYVWNWDGLIRDCLQADPARRPESLLMALETIKIQANSSVSFLQHHPEIAADGHKKSNDSESSQEHFKSSKVLATTHSAAVPAQKVVNQDENAASLKPILHVAQLERPETDLDPGSVFNIDTTVKFYVPERKEIKNTQPLLTDMIIVHGGDFFRGSNDGNRDEVPRHQVTLDSFAIDIHPVTNEQFVRFLEAMGGEKDSNHHDIIRLRDSRIKRSGGRVSIESGYSKHPVVGVTWYGAVAYAKWVGKRLPTEAEWEISAYGGLEGALYQTGDDIEKTQANFFSADTTPVMSYAPNGYGLYDMAGNVYEWCHDWYSYNYYEISIQEPENPKGPLQGVYRVLRGGCWKSLKEDLRCSRRHRNNPGTVNGTYGFRCAADVQ